MLDAVIFDMDGLMVDTEKVWERSKMRECERLGIPFSHEFDSLTRGTSGKTFVRCVEEYFASIGYPGVDGQAFLDDIWGMADQAFEEGGVEKKPGLDELLVWLAEHDIPRAVASGSKLVQVEHHLSLLGLLDKFTMAVSGFDIANSKPAPDIFLKVARELGSNPATTVVLEDSVNGIKAAHTGGFIPIMVPDRDTPEEAGGLYRYVCKDLLEVRDLLASGAV